MSIVQWNLFPSFVKEEWNKNDESGKTVAGKRVIYQKQNKQWKQYISYKGLKRKTNN
jgi:hypothetical protein